MGKDSLRVFSGKVHTGWWDDVRCQVFRRAIKRGSRRYLSREIEEQMATDDEPTELEVALEVASWLRSRP